MPRNGSGVYSQPAGSTAVANTIADPNAFNTLMTDLGTEITGSLPRAGTAAMLGALTLFASGSNPLHATAIQQIFDTTGRALFEQDISTSTPTAPSSQTTIGALNPGFQVHGASANAARMGLYGWNFAPEFIFSYSSGAYSGAYVPGGNNNLIGRIRFAQVGNTLLEESAAIAAYSDGNAPGSNTNTPGRISIWTTPPASATPLERLRVDSAGVLWTFTAGSFPNFQSIHAGGHVISTGDSGFGSNALAGNANDLIIESANSTGVSIVARNGQTSSIYFAKPTVTQSGSIIYTYAATTSNETLAYSSSGPHIWNVGGVEAMRLIKSSAQYRLTLQGDQTAYLYQDVNGGTGSISLGSNSSETLRITATNRLVYSFDNSSGSLGTSVPANIIGTSVSPGLQIHGTSGNGSRMGIYGWGSSSIPELILFSSGTATIGTNTRNASGDTIGRIRISAADPGGATAGGQEVAGLQWNIDPNGGAIIAGNLPTVLHVYTSKSGTEIRNEVLRLDGDGTATFFGQVSFPSWAAAKGGVGISTGSSGATTVGTTADDLVVEGAGNTGITIMAGATSTAAIFFGRSAAVSDGKIVYDHNVKSLAFNTNGSLQLTITSNGSIYSTAGTAVGTNMLPVAGGVLIQAGVPAVDGSPVAGHKTLVIVDATNAGITLAHGSTTGSSTIDFFRSAGTQSAGATMSQIQVTSATGTTSDMTIQSERHITLTAGAISTAADITLTAGSASGTIVLNPGTTGFLKSLLTYSFTVGATFRALSIDNSGKIGGLTSSRRFKQGIADMPQEIIQAAKQIRPVQFEYIHDPSLLQYGVIAEELDALGIGANIVTRDQEGQIDGVNYAQMVSLAFGVIRDQEARIAALETRIAA